MLNVPHDLYTSEQIRQLENIAINEHNLSASVLMSRAGRAGLDSLKRHWPHTERILILCGTGNNGGDGFELARQAATGDYCVMVMQVGDESKLTPTAQAARDALIATGTEIQRFKDKLPSTDIIVDALIGTGLNREVTDDFKAIIKVINTISILQFYHLIFHLAYMLTLEMFWALL